MIDLYEQYRIGSVPSIYLIPNFISKHTEDQLFNNIDRCKNWKTVDSGRSVQCLGGSISGKGKLIATSLPEWVDPLVHKLSSTGIFGESSAPNHILINSYQPGQGIMPHKDGPLYFPAVCIISLGSPTVIKFFTERDDSTPSKVVSSIVLPPRSALIFKDDAYTKCLHGIDFVQVHELNLDANTHIDPASSLEILDAVASKTGGTCVLHRTGRRVSLTVRRVLQVHKFGLLATNRKG